MGNTSYKDITGLRSGKLVAVRDTGGKNKQGNYIWECLCDCGNTIFLASAAIHPKRTRSCGCLVKDNRLPDEEVILNKLFASYRCAANSRGYDFELTKEEFHSLIKQNCYFCGATPNLTDIKYNTRRLTAYYNGVDRLNNEEGYLLENCKPCCRTCNVMKQDLTEEDFYTHIKKIINYGT